jgi:hypothetical protein
VGLIVGIDRLMSEARALTNFAGNAVATVLVGTWTHEIDNEQARAVLAGELPFDETSFNDDPHLIGADPVRVGGDSAADDEEGDDRSRPPAGH